MKEKGLTMGRTTVEAFVTGKNGVRSYDFLVVTGCNFMGLPLEDIEALGLYKFPGGRYKLTTALGVIDDETYAASVRIGDDSAPAIVAVSNIPFIGYWLLENLRMKFNPVTQKLEKAPENEIMPPYAL